MKILCIYSVMSIDVTHSFEKRKIFGMVSPLQDFIVKARRAEARMSCKRAELIL